MPEKPQLRFVWEVVPEGTHLAQRLKVPAEQLLMKGADRANIAVWGFSADRDCP